MNIMAIEELMPVLQACVAPCVVISGVGLLLLAMTNRLARPIDRVRVLCRQISEAKEGEKDYLAEQIKIFLRRAAFLRTAIGMSVASIFFVAVMILLLFVTFVFDVRVNGALEILFGVSIICLVTSLAYLLADVFLTLRSLQNETRKRAGIEL
ncbi:DUF2721 domain-containing protein [Dethiosulfatarculus sandiegensis]|uniref:DUF2721 domain-containing protein n=1 Tax=Dethiosulfatarculus sandiegensis TaxID=1429043 RepID=A0A0D2HPX7_9BACT|nr:DUF2721 domain-containing protein [Dethiosulfatarculus sandiegensis]KIX12503.1 hypothetical protein X474_18765 [Dethiosulfatarculus sandiegensis]